MVRLLGICAERNAIFNMITNGEDEIKRVIAISSGER
jgi:cytidine deaminase